jgi:hypothetical protein
VEILSTSWDEKTKYFSGLKAYMYYSTLPPLEKNSNKIWTSGIALTGCVPKVYDFKELISWCIDKFDKE